MQTRRFSIPNQENRNAAFIPSPKALKSYFLLVFLPYPFTQLYFAVPLSFWICLYISYCEPKEYQFLYLLIFAMPYIMILINFEEERNDK